MLVQPRPLACPLGIPIPESAVAKRPPCWHASRGLALPLAHMYQNQGATTGQLFFHRVATARAWPRPQVGSRPLDQDHLKHLSGRNSLGEETKIFVSFLNHKSLLFLFICIHCSTT